ncbi:MAG: cache domain-containing protein [Elusimicrobiaceae bacterium]|nr:cache domain-containing protein [Elusimicrobiaceae bacterium]
MKKSFSFVQFVCVLLACTALVSIAIALYVNHLTRALEKETFMALQEFAAQDAKQIEMQVTEDLNLLSAIASSIAVLPDANEEELLELLQVERKQNHFKNMEFIRPDGTAQLDNGKTLDLSKGKNFNRTLKGTAGISSRETDLVDGTSILVEMVPIWYRDKVIGVLAGTHYTLEFAKTLDMQAFGGNGYSLLVEADGDKVVESFHKNAVSGLYNIFDTPDDPDHKLRNQVLKDFSARKSGIVKYHSKQRGTLYVSYQPININDWYIICVVPEKFVIQVTQSFVTLLPVLCLLIALAAFLLGCYIWHVWPALKEHLSKPEA